MSAAIPKAKVRVTPKPKVPLYPGAGFGWPVGQPPLGGLPVAPAAPAAAAGAVTPVAAPAAKPIDWGQLIGGDWEVQQAETDFAKQMAASRANFQNALRQQFIDLGASGLQGISGNLSSYIDADTIKQAVANKYSANAQISDQAMKARRQMSSALAARGILASGQATKSSGDIAAQAEQGRYNALRDFLSGGTQGLGALTQTESSLAQALAAARASAGNRLAQTYPVGGDSGITDTGGGQRYDAGPVNTVPVAAPKPKVPAGMIQGSKGLYYTPAQFQRVKPGGSYQAYLTWLRNHRGGVL